MSYINENNLDIQFINDQSIIDKYSEHKMREKSEVLVQECELYIDSQTKSNPDLTNNENTHLKLITEIISYYREKGKLSNKQRKCLCSYIAYETFFEIGPKIMLEQLAIK